MIDKINLTAGSNIRFQGNTNLLDNFKGTLKNFENYNYTNLNGSEALANYNKPMVKEEFNLPKPDENIEKFIIKETIEPIKLTGNETETLQGDKIYDKDGKLEAIIIKGEKTSKEYEIDKENNKVSAIAERDNTTGNIVRADYFGTEYNKNTSSFTKIFDPDTNKMIKEAYFDEGNLRSINIIDNKENRSIENSFENDGSLYSIKVTDLNTGISNRYSLDNRKQIKFIEICDENYNTLRNYSYQNGKVEEITEHKYKPLKNIYGITPDNISLKPADFIEKPKVESLNGEKKYRSNGTLESVTVQNGDLKTEYLIGYDGKNVYRINEFEKDQKIKSYDFGETGSLNIKEYKNDKIHKITFYKENKKLESIFELNEKSDITKTLDYSADGSYIRRYSEENNPEYGSINLKFNKNKELIGVDIQNIEKTQTSFKE